jgi:ABC-type glycerol-3-phosphate transport system substrate-binding protein
MDNDWQVVDPFLSLLFSNGGQYLSADNTKALFNSPSGVAALEAELRLFKQGSTDVNGNFFDFGKNKVAMVIAPPWTKSGFQTNFGAAFESTIPLHGQAGDVAIQLVHGCNGEKPAQTGGVGFPAVVRKRTNDADRRPDPLWQSLG